MSLVKHYRATVQGATVRGGHRRRTAAKGKPEFRIIVSQWNMESTEDSFEHGEVGGSGDRSAYGDGGDFPDLKSVIKFLSHYGAPTEKKYWYAFSGEDGRLECQWTGDEDGAPLSKKEEADWKEGKFKAYNWLMTAYLQFGTVYTPSAREMAKKLGIKEE